MNVSKCIPDKRFENKATLNTKVISENRIPFCIKLFLGQQQPIQLPCTSKIWQSKVNRCQISGKGAADFESFLETAFDRAFRRCLKSLKRSDQIHSSLRVKGIVRRLGRLTLFVINFIETVLGILYCPHCRKYSFKQRSSAAVFSSPAACCSCKHFLQNQYSCFFPQPFVEKREKLVN